ncbi:MAG TPA: hypothetical protein VMW16_10155 [Sedimentisphaerales bacterium]|nr:hypothetical protein [Sedimentisphaerales bacterium]
MEGGGDPERQKFKGKAKNHTAKFKGGKAKVKKTREDSRMGLGEIGDRKFLLTVGGGGL